MTWGPRRFRGCGSEVAFQDLFYRQAMKKALSGETNYITTFLERDLPQLGISIASNTLRRFWTMLGHYHAQIINYSELARNFGISDMTARKYIDLLEGTFMLRLLQPWYTNIGKRLVKRPKLYLTDSGIFHSLIGVGRREELMRHNKLGQKA